MGRARCNNLSRYAPLSLDSLKFHENRNEFLIGFIFQSLIGVLTLSQEKLLDAISIMLSMYLEEKIIQD